MDMPILDAILRGLLGTFTSLKIRRDEKEYELAGSVIIWRSGSRSFYLSDTLAYQLNSVSPDNGVQDYLRIERREADFRRIPRKTLEKFVVAEMKNL